MPVLHHADVYACASNTGKKAAANSFDSNFFAHHFTIPYLSLLLGSRSRVDLNYVIKNYHHCFADQALILGAVEEVWRSLRATTLPDLLKLCVARPPPAAEVEDDHIVIALNGDRVWFMERKEDMTQTPPVMSYTLRPATITESGDDDGDESGDDDAEVEIRIDGSTTQRAYLRDLRVMDQETDINYVVRLWVTYFEHIVPVINRVLRAIEFGSAPQVIDMKADAIVVCAMIGVPKQVARAVARDDVALSLRESNILTTHQVPASDAAVPE